MYFSFDNYQVRLRDQRLTSNPLLETLYSLKYNKGIEGDADGRKRLRATAELGFVFYMTEYAELFRYKSAERQSIALRNAGLPEDYPISDELQAYLEFVQQETESLPRKALRRTSDMLHNSNRMIEVINHKLEAKMEEMMDEEDVDEADIEIIQKLMDKALTLSKKLDEAAEQVIKSEKKYNEELEDMIGQTQLTEWELNPDW